LPISTTGETRRSEKDLHGIGRDPREFAIDLSPDNVCEQQRWLRDAMACQANQQGDPPPIRAATGMRALSFALDTPPAGVERKAGVDC
jgi:hypothetical protein